MTVSQRFGNDADRSPPPAEPDATVSPIRHGTEWGYRRCRKANGGKACDACRAAVSDAETKRQAARKNKPIPDGARHGRYLREIYGCNCNICVPAFKRSAAERKRASRARRKEAS